jgi:hypothetical protein
MVQSVTAYGWLVYLEEVRCVLWGIRWNRDIMSLFLCPTIFENGIQRNDE